MPAAHGMQENFGFELQIFLVAQIGFNRFYFPGNTGQIGLVGKLDENLKRVIAPFMLILRGFYPIRRGYL
ncbi:hypothetical protein [Larkinella punicea]|uniref:hypothetical protein n=1 Tax=Larkinella punicea TaxID=2315727 RepID=UPI00286E3505|nr:hypothetical protein [Larkinella punicea]